MAEDINNLDNQEKSNVTTVNLDTNSEKENSEQNPNNEQLQTEIEQITKKKTPLIKKILIGLVGFLLLVIIAGATLYFTGFFEPEVVEEVQQEPTAMQQEQPKEDNSYKFEIKDINSKKLNEQLANLTNKNIIQEKNEEREKLENERKLIEEQKIKEEEALKQQEEKLLKEKQALEETKKLLEKEKAQLESLRQEALNVKEQLVDQDNIAVKETEKLIEQSTPKPSSSNHKETVVKEEKEVTKADVEEESSTSDNNMFLRFISVAKIKGQLYKKYLDKVVSVNSNVILCRDDKNRIELYFGPFKNESERDELLNKLLDKGFDQAYKLEFTKDEFDARCNY